MPGLSRFIHNNGTSTIITLAQFLADDEMPALRQNKLPPAFRTADVTAQPDTLSRTYTDQGFSEFKQATKTAHHATLTAATRQSPELSNVVRKLDGSTPIETTFRGRVPLEPHAETDQYLSYMMFCTWDQKPDKKDYTFQFLTNTYLNVKHKLIFLSVGVSQEDLQWSRDFSKTWAEAILSANQ